MANFIVVLKLVILFCLINPVFGKMDRIHTEVYLGEKKLDSYYERYQPLIFHNIYNGQMSFKDDVFFQEYFKPYLFHPEIDYSHFLKSEVSSGIQCSNETLAEHFDDIQFSYRLIALSYLLEADWHLDLLTKHFELKNGCQFDLTQWLQTCRPKSLPMKNFVKRLRDFLPRYNETIPAKYKKEDWFKDFKDRSYKYYSHYRMLRECKDCDAASMPSFFNKSCEGDKKIMTLICSEEDEIYGMSKNLDAYSLIAQSNIINTYNKQGEALGCLRRFSEMMSPKEVKFSALNNLFPPIKNYLREIHNERFLQGRVFFYGSSKEFEEKGLSDIHVQSQPFKITQTIPEASEEKSIPKKVEEKKSEDKVVVTRTTPEIKKEEVREIQKPLKSAFLLASELRKGQELDRVEVDMLKFKYDYVFSLNMINTLSERLKTFMTREALKEMMTYDKLGLKEGPVPLLFIKFMIDMQEHQGLWNLISVLGDKFYVSNEIDSTFVVVPELIHLVNNDSTGNQWTLFVIKP
jgi:hypothetical protein